MRRTCAPSAPCALRLKALRPSQASTACVPLKAPLILLLRRKSFPNRPQQGASSTLLAPPRKLASRYQARRNSIISALPQPPEKGGFNFNLARSYLTNWASATSTLTQATSRLSIFTLASISARTPAMCFNL